MFDSILDLCLSLTLGPIEANLITKPTAITKEAKINGFMISSSQKEMVNDAIIQ